MEKPLGWLLGLTGTNWELSWGASSSSGSAHPLYGWTGAHPRAPHIRCVSTGRHRLGPEYGRMRRLLIRTPCFFFFSLLYPLPGEGAGAMPQAGCLSRHDHDSNTRLLLIPGHEERRGFATAPLEIAFGKIIPCVLYISLSLSLALWGASAGVLRSHDCEPLVQSQDKRMPKREPSSSETQIAWMTKRQLARSSPRRS